MKKSKLLKWFLKVRKLTSHWGWKIKSSNRNLKDLREIGKRNWNYLVKLQPYSFFNSSVINRYISDPFKGAFDYTVYDKYVLAADKDELYKDAGLSFDCDDYAYIGHLYLKEKEIEHWTVLIADRHAFNFPSLHFFVVFKLAGKYHLASWGIKGSFNSMEDAINMFVQKKMVSYGKYRNLLYWSIHNDF